MKEVTTRPYRASDQAGCLAVFDTNVPTFFAPAERAEFGAFLVTVDDPGHPYLVLTDADTVVGCGGLYVEPGNPHARLAWGMIDRALHRQGLGRHLTTARLDMARTIPGVTEIGLETSQHTNAFYAGFGFTASRITPDGLAPGLDSYEMVLRL